MQGIGENEMKAKNSFTTARHFGAFFRKSGLALLFVIMLLSACGHPAGDFSFEMPDTTYGKDIGVKYIEADDGIQLAYRDMGEIEAPKAMVIVPGSTMYGYYYLPFMRAMAEKELYLRVIDLRGHGDSGGKRGDVPGENTLVNDMDRHISEIRSANSDAEIFLCGHSMGAGICGRYLETYGYGAVAGAVYLAPFFHYRQPGMKDADYVDVNIFKTVFGGNHEVTQVYHPSSDDPKLVRKYTKMMSRASMVSDFSDFRQDYDTDTLFLIGKKDELFDWRESKAIFPDSEPIDYVVLPEASHLDVDLKGGQIIKKWLEKGH